MKLLLINYEFPPVGAGAGNATDHTARHLSAVGHDVVVLTAAHGSLPKREERHGYTVLRAPALRKRPDHSTPVEMLSFTFGGALRALSLMKTWRPDASLCYFTLPCAPIGWLLQKRLGIPYAVLLRGGDVPGFEPERMARLHTLCGPAIRGLWKDAAAVSANCRWLASLAEKALPGLNVPVIPNGVDTAEFAPHSAQKEHDAPLRLLFTGRLASQKGVDVLLRALARTVKGLVDDVLPVDGLSVDGQFVDGQSEEDADHHGTAPHGTGASAIRPDTPRPAPSKVSAPPLRLSIVGDGPLRADLEKEAARMGIADRVDFHGWLKREELPGAFAGADLFVLPSLDEGMPNVVLEAMASGLPVVGTHAGGTPELVEEGDTGLLVPPGDDRSLARALLSLMHDPERRRRMGVNGRRRAEAEFSWQHVAQGMAELARNMIRNHSEAPNPEGAHR